MAARKQPAKRQQVDDDRGRVLKVLFFDEKMEPVGEWASHQIPEDPFGSKMQGLQKPPLSPEQLVFFAEMHPIHSAALEQKVADVVGNGWEWVTEDEQADAKLRDELEEWWMNLAVGEESMHETLMAVTDDFETVGWGCLEIVRENNDPKEEVKAVWHIPAHTTRFASDGLRVCQVRSGKRVWFKRWGTSDERNVHAGNGRFADEGDDFGEKTAHEVLVFKKPSRRSSWYGIPGYISAVGWITLGLATRDDNIMFFTNRREPRWAVILSNLQDDPNLADDLEQAFKIDLQQPHRNLLIPIAGKGKVEFEKLGTDRADGSYEKLEDRSDAKVLVAHRVPPERLGIGKVGPLGGDKTVEASRVYKEGVVSNDQALIAARVNRFIRREFTAAHGKDDWTCPWNWNPRELDLAEDKANLELAVMAFKHNIVPLAEARAMMGQAPLPDIEDPSGEVPLDSDGKPQTDEKGEPLPPMIPDPRNDYFYADFAGGSAAAAAMEPEDDAETQARLDEIRGEIRELLIQADEDE